jgi:hypothetical protein
MLQALNAQILQIQNHPCLRDSHWKLLRAVRYAEKDPLFTPIIFCKIINIIVQNVCIISIRDEEYTQIVNMSD